jgi:hypothetical protein
MAKQSLLVKTKDGRVLELKEFIKYLKFNNKPTATDSTSDRVQEINDQISSSCLNVVTLQEKDTKTPAERLEYQKRMDRLRVKIQNQEYDSMTKNVRTKFQPGFGKMVQEIGSASKLAYSNVTIAISILVSVLAFYFIPIVLLPQTVPLGARVICGLVSATLILCVDVLYYARAFQNAEDKVKLE